MDFVQTSPGYFAEIVGDLLLCSPIHAENVDPVGDLAAYPGARFYLSEDQNSGFGVTSDGELKWVWSTVRGRGDTIVEHGLLAGATHLNCFEGHLSDLYGRHGFIVTERLENWTPGGPDVVTMQHPKHWN